MCVCMEVHNCIVELETDSQWNLFDIDMCVIWCALKIYNNILMSTQNSDNFV